MRLRDDESLEGRFSSHFSVLLGWGSWESWGGWRSWGSWGGWGSWGSWGGKNPEFYLASHDG